MAFRSFASAMVVVPVALGLMACSAIRVVKRSPSGGEVALMGTRDASHEKAEQYMADQCPNGYTIVEEGEVVVGQTTEEHYQANGTAGSTTDKREWRIKYTCNGAPGAHAPDAVPAAPTSAPAPAPAPPIRPSASNGEVREIRYYF